MFDFLRNQILYFGFHQYDHKFNLRYCIIICPEKIKEKIQTESHISRKIRKNDNNSVFNPFVNV